MRNKDLQAIVLAAGKANRFKTGRTKLLETICGQEMILYATKLLEKLNIETTVVVGHQKSDVESTIKNHHNNCTFVYQKEQLGTGHAVTCTRKTWNKEHILILNGDMPLVTAEIIEQLYKKHTTNNAAISFVASHIEHTQHAYGRIVRKNKTIKIVEAKDFTGDPNAHCWINAGIYLVNRTFLENYIKQLHSNNASHEFYITDLVGIASDSNLTVETVPAPFDNIRGINTLEELWAAEQIKQLELIRNWMQNGVRFIKAQNVHLDINVTIGKGSCIGGGVYLLGNTTIGEHCTIREYTTLEHAIVGNGSTIKSHSVVTNATVAANKIVGPFAHIDSTNTFTKKLYQQNRILKGPSC